MCFRPADVSGPKTCPSCGKIIPVIPGMPVPETCPGCGTPLDGDEATGAARPEIPTPAPTAPNAPASPHAPGRPQG